MTRRLGIACCTLVALLAFPRASGAGLLDFIWELSGPRMLGVVGYCKVGSGGFYDCKIPAETIASEGQRPPLRVSLEAGAYVSVPWGSPGGTDYGFADVFLLAFDPMLEWQWGSSRLTGGVGPTLNLVFGNDFRRIGKVGIKARPITFPIGHRVDFHVNLRVYFDRYLPGDFGFGPRSEGPRPTEVALGFAFAFPSR